ncbi:melanocyte-stimulating hormone receptor-like [Stylophora pistillata]|uniref:melanocyte-stimulating hormone receptor-like n=1 Tax=Stylophora pistillata TaxID=50429 RepID=UPI000C05339B|nr:melanocyte-stimulating hormone receptor-like [Stylophora pistillata]
MEMANFSDGKKYSGAFEQQRCSVSLTRGIEGHLKYLIAFNIFLSLIAFLGNTVVLVALRKETSLHPPSKLLFRCLAATDLCVGLITEPMNVNYWVSLLKEDWNTCLYAYKACFITSYILSSISLLTITAISVDRLLALLLGLRYKPIVTLKRTYVAVITFWFISTTAATLYLLNHLITFLYGYIFISFCSFISICSYTKIFLTLRRHRIRAQETVSDAILSQEMNLARYRKAVYSALWVQMALVACYIPYGIVGDLFSHSKLTPSKFFFLEVTISSVYLNSSLNPFLYCWKISEVRNAVKKTIRQALCHLFN